MVDCQKCSRRPESGNHGDIEDLLLLFNLVGAVKAKGGIDPSVIVEMDLCSRTGPLLEVVRVGPIGMYGIVRSLRQFESTEY
jgi:hypothetical protein